MGNWSITIFGRGPHHNPDHPGDADRIYKETVKKLEEAGQKIDYAAFSHGSREDNTPGDREG